MCSQRFASGPRIPKIDLWHIINILGSHAASIKMQTKLNEKTRSARPYVGTWQIEVPLLKHLAHANWPICHSLLHTGNRCVSCFLLHQGSSSITNRDTGQVSHRTRQRMLICSGWIEKSLSSSTARRGYLARGGLRVLTSVCMSIVPAVKM